MQLSVPIFRLKRQARLLSREARIPLAEALDRMARREGFRSWSLLAKEASRRRPADRLLAEFAPGELVLLAARPGHGKTLLGLELASTAARLGRDAFFFTLEETETGIRQRLRDLGIRDDGGRLTIDPSDAISADHVVSRLRGTPAGGFAVIDYLQLLDRRRSEPELAIQLRVLRDFAKARDVTFVALSQVDRSFDGLGRPMPGPSDIRLPNPVDLGLFSQACFLHDGRLHLQALGAAQPSS